MAAEGLAISSLTGEKKLLVMFYSLARLKKDAQGHLEKISYLDTSQGLITPGWVTWVKVSEEWLSVC